MGINSTTPEMWDALRKKHAPIELTNALNNYAAEAEKEAEDMVTAPRQAGRRLKESWLVLKQVNRDSYRGE